MLQVPQIKLTGNPCPRCGTEFARLAPSGLCMACDHTQRNEELRVSAAARRQREIDETIGRLDQYVLEQLRSCGMATQELRATLDRIPREAKAAIPPASATAMIAGKVPDDGWGLVGTTGTGKSLAIAALLKAQVRAALASRIPEEGPIPVDWIRWESVPSLVDWLRDHARSEPDLVAARIHAACTAKVLVLDDLGAERRIGGYGSDYATGKLDLIVDARWRECLPTWYTANVDGEEGLVGAYGARMVSRLCGPNPCAMVSGLDMRLASA